jgi:hypothetical protein
MIKKNTKAIFINGDFKGEYDWKGGIPLSEGETMTVKINGKLLKYKLTKKKIFCDAENEDQIIDILYSFELL